MTKLYIILGLLLCVTVYQYLEIAINSGCFSANTNIELYNGTIVNIKNISIGDKIRSDYDSYSTVYYKYVHYGAFRLWHYYGVRTTPNHLIKNSDGYVLARDVGSESYTESEVVYLLTYDNHVYINNFTFSVHSGNHYLGVLKTIPIRMLPICVVDLAMKFYEL